MPRHAALADSADTLLSSYDFTRFREHFSFLAGVASGGGGLIVMCSRSELFIWHILRSFIRRVHRPGQHG